MKYDIRGEHNGFKFFWKIDNNQIVPDRMPAKDCPECSGSGKKWGPDYQQETCWRCNGHKKITDTSFNPPPPSDLVEGMRKVWFDCWNRQQNEQFQLTPTEKDND